MEYRICEANSAAKLQRKVNRLIAEGWRPAGGVAATPSAATSNWWYYQAMIQDPAGPEAAASKPPATGLDDFD